MSTSANVTYYRVYKNGVFVKEHRQNALCKSKIHEELSQYSPVEDFTVVVRWPDEDEANHLDDKMPLSKFLRGKPKVEDNREATTGRRETWDEYFMGLARYVSTRSKDRSTKIGAVLVGPNKEVRSTSYNGFPRGVDDDVDSRHERPAKYLFTAHAEVNGITNAARVGTPTEGCILYVSGRPPCADCARAIIQAGIKEVIVETMEHKSRPEMDWEANTKAAMEMLREAGIIVRMVQ